MSDPRLDQLTDFTFAFTGGPRFYAGFETLVRTASASGLGSESAVGVRIAFRTATGSGTGTESADGISFTVFTATASSSGVGTETASGDYIRVRTATGSGTGSSTATAIEKLPRTATGSGAGSTGASVTWNKLFIFRPPVNDSFAWNDPLRPRAGDFLLRKLVPGTRAKNVYKLTDGSYTTNQPAEVEDYVLVHYGAHNNFVSASEKADLISAGYGEYVT